MADLICRWRNGTPKTVVELVNILPHKKMPVDDFRNYMNQKWDDFFHTPYQLACQLSLYCEAEDGFYYPRFDHDINEGEAEDYLKFWITRYYVPNPFVAKGGFDKIKCPTFFLKSLCDYTKDHPCCEYTDAYFNCFGEIAKNNDDIIRNYINNFSQVLNFSKEGILTLKNANYEEYLASMDRNDKKAFFDNFNLVEVKHQTHKFVFHFPSQVIYYGVPGCGKSHKIDEQLKSVPEYNKVRVVFHPEYTNADFVGQIQPVVSGGVSYDFVAGPFTRILARAYAHPSQHFYLVIEEINRGNASAIFGEVFQLLDRLKSGEKDDIGGNVYTAGWSKYSVDNIDINAKICHEINNAKYAENEERPSINFTANTAVRLPPNLSIFATMNTSDQNVFTLDNAFQRRFDMELVRNEFKDASGNFKSPEIQAQYEALIGDTEICWGEFWQWINSKITNLLKGLASTEDKRLGVWFVASSSDKSGVRKIDKKLFAEKVLKYLWDDAFKFKRSNIFSADCDTLENLVNKFESAAGKSAFDIFKDFLV